MLNVLAAGLLAMVSLSSTAPMRSGIDAYCARADRAPAQAFSREMMENRRAFDAWHRSSEVEETRVQRDPQFVEGEFAIARLANNNVVRATLSKLDATGDGSVSYDYCYRNNSLVRLRTTIASATFEAIWTRTDYYAFAEMLARTESRRDLSKHRIQPLPPFPNEQPPMYVRPQLLPFFKEIRI